MTYSQIRYYKPPREAKPSLFGFFKEILEFRMKTLSSTVCYESLTRQVENDKKHRAESKQAVPAVISNNVTCMKWRSAEGGWAAKPPSPELLMPKRLLFDIVWAFLRIIWLSGSHPCRSIFPSVYRIYTDINCCIFHVQSLFPGKLKITTGQECVQLYAEKCMCAVEESDWTVRSCCLGQSPDGQTCKFLRGVFVFFTPSLFLNHTHCIEHYRKGK